MAVAVKKPEDALALRAPTPSYMCPLSANRYGVESSIEHVQVLH